MLPVEFYFLNATTTLLWLCQTVPHEVLLILMALGAVCVLVSVLVIVSRIVLSCSVVFKISVFACNFLIRKTVARYFNRGIIQSIALGNLPQASDNTPLRLEFQGRSLTLPQLLSLCPDRWAELEPTHTSSSSMPESVPNSEPSSRPVPDVRQLATSASVLRPLPRRSARVSRARPRIDI